MAKYVLKRVLLMLLTLFIITTIEFVLIRMLPRELPQEKVQAAAIASRWEALGYNKPLLVQYGIYLKNIVTSWDFGTSWYIEFREPAWNVLTKRLLPTVLVNLYSLIFSIPVGIGLGIYAAIRKNKWQDQVISVMVMLFVSIPSYVYAFLVQYFLYFKWNLLPLQVYSLADAGNSWTSWKMFVSMISPILAQRSKISRLYERTGFPQRGRKIFGISLFMRVELPAAAITALTNGFMSFPPGGRLPVFCHCGSGTAGCIR